MTAMQQFKNSLIELITRTSTDLPPDVRAAMQQAQAHEIPDTQSASALKIIAANIDMAAGSTGPICQDTGMPIFEIRTPVGVDQLRLRTILLDAIAETTRQGKLRPNAVDPISGDNSGDNLGPGMPVLHWQQWENNDEIEVRLLLKGGGCENKNSQYALPCELPHLGRADRTLEGVRKCILHAVWQAQGQGCSTGALGVCIGGDRATGYAHAKTQLFRALDDRNPDQTLAGLEDYILQAANTLGIGTMGFGGKVTLIGCKIGKLNRLPASFFVSVATTAGLSAGSAWCSMPAPAPYAAGCIRPMTMPQKMHQKLPQQRRASSAPDTKFHCAPRSMKPPCADSASATSC